MNPDAPTSLDLGPLTELNISPGIPDLWMVWDLPAGDLSS